MKKKNRAPRRSGTAPAAIAPAPASSSGTGIGTETASAHGHSHAHAPAPTHAYAHASSGGSALHSDDSGLVIHDYEKNQTALMKWYKHNQNKPWFWRTIVAAILIPLIALVLWSWYGGQESQTAEAWRELASAFNKTSASELEKVAEELGDQPTAAWAWLQLGDRSLSDGVDSLPSNRDSAESSLEKARDAYNQVIRLAPKNSTLARLGQFGLARTLESRNELKKAIEAYREITENSNWKETNEAKQAVKLIELLDRPETQKFYQELYAYKPTLANPPSDTVTVPPPPDSLLGPSSKPDPLLPDALPDPSLSPANPTPKPAPDLPDNVFQKPDAPAPAPSPAPAPEPEPSDAKAKTP